MRFSFLDFIVNTDGNLTRAGSTSTSVGDVDAITKSLESLKLSASPEGSPVKGGSKDDYDDLYSDSDTDVKSRSSLGPDTKDYFASEELSSEDESPSLVDYGRLEGQLRAFFGS
jgi:hypothetical protein